MVHDTRWFAAFAAAWLLIGYSTEQVSAGAWRYTFREPEAGWMRPDFDDSAWKQGRPGFGAGNVHGSPIGTRWTTSDIWTRGHVELPAKLPENVCLRMHHDEDVEVYVNGVLSAKAAGFTRGYERYAMSRASIAALRPGKNLIAAHCRQTRGGQFIDIHIVEGTAMQMKGDRPGTKRRTPTTNDRDRSVRKRECMEKGNWLRYSGP